MRPKKCFKKKKKITFFHRQNLDCNLFREMPSKSMRKALLSSDTSDPHLQEKVPFSSRLYQIKNPSPSQKRTFMWSRYRLRKMKKAPDKSSPEKIARLLYLIPWSFFSCSWAADRQRAGRQPALLTFFCLKCLEVFHQNREIRILSKMNPDLLIFNYDPGLVQWIR